MGHRLPTRIWSREQIHRKSLDVGMEVPISTSKSQAGDLLLFVLLQVPVAHFLPPSRPSLTPGFPLSLSFHHHLSFYSRHQARISVRHWLLHRVYVFRGINSSRVGAFWKLGPTMVEVRGCYPKK